MEQQSQKINYSGFIIAGLIIIAAYFGFKWLSSSTNTSTTNTPVTSTQTNKANCLIKGNISQTSGEKIYHVPGGAFYDKTNIDEAYGERWFCSEAEAHTAGWRKSQR